jgi:hypothetical protein
MQHEVVLRTRIDQKKVDATLTASVPACSNTRHGFDQSIFEGARSCPRTQLEFFGDEQQPLARGVLPNVSREEIRAYGLLIVAKWHVESGASMKHCKLNDVSVVEISKGGADQSEAL